MALAAVTAQDRLTQGNAIRNARHRTARRLRVLRAAVAVVAEALRPLLGAIDEGCIFVAHLAAKLDEQLLTSRRPHRRHEKALLGRPSKPSRLHAGIAMHRTAREAPELMQRAVISRRHTARTDPQARALVQAL